MSNPQPADNAVFVASVNTYAQYILDWATRKGFRVPCAHCQQTGQRHLDGSPGDTHNGLPTVQCPDCAGTRFVFRNFGEQIALCHSELSELMEAHRCGEENAPDEHCGDFTKAEIEVADTIIRLLDMSAAYGWNVGAAICAKMAYNESRPFRHGKRC
ncbi:MAG TPA: hypothetical protein VKE94_20980 [Gemmataceae bacterium]|nr:hypothetical protein [Gemmataceae bacterium]